MPVLLWGALLLWALLLARVLLDTAVWPVEPAAAPASAPHLAVIVPARNEAHQIERCLGSPLAQEWPRLTVICVDDRSDDRTFEAASAIADARLVVVRGRELPTGWLGKNCRTFWERLLLRSTIAAIVQLYPVRKVNDPRSKVAIANGKFLLMPRADYEAVGGHAAIFDRVADDLELARLVKQRRVLRAEDGRALVSVRMYTSLPEIWWGFVKNASAGAGGP